MALRTVTVFSMLASLTLVAPGALARGHGGGGHGGGGGHSSGGHGGGGGAHGGSSGQASMSGGGSGGHAAGFSDSPHASFRGDSESGTSESHATVYGSGHSSTQLSSARAMYGYSNPTAASSLGTARTPVLHTMPSANESHETVHGGVDGPIGRSRITVAGSADAVVGAPVVVTGRVRERAPRYSVRGVAVEGWSPQSRFRVPTMYSGYFTPYAVYVDETYWVTDWVITDTLVGEETVMEGPSDLGAPPMEVAVKEELREEILLDMSAPLETEARVDDPRIRAALANPAHIFLVSRDMAVQNAKGFACALRAADLVRPLSPVAREDKNVSVVVLAAKGGECAPGEHVALAASDLAGFERDLLTRVDRARASVSEGDAAPQPGTAAP